MKTLISLALAALFIGCSGDNKKSPESQSINEVSVKQAEKKVEPRAKIEEDPIKKESESVTAVKTGENIFKACSGCHGQNAEKVALGKSQIIKGWSVKRTTDALNGYKTGSYGGAMKGVMKGQASQLSENDIKLVAEYISKL